MRVKQIIDLSVPLENGHYTGLSAPELTYYDHREGARILGRALGLPQSSFPEGEGLAWEHFSGVTHAGTHLDAPWHYGPTSEGEQAKTIDKIPLEWCFGYGVRLDMRHKGKGESISILDITSALEKINYEINPLDIVFIWTDADKHAYEPGYTEIHPGMSEEATLYLVDKGVKIIGIDAYGFDVGFLEMVKAYKDGDAKALWPAHFAGRKKEYYHLEAMANLDKIPIDHGFEAAVFPVNIAKASGAWCRAVAIIRE